MKNEQKARAEVAMMGRVVECTTDEVCDFIKYIAKTCLGRNYNLDKDFVNNTLQRYNHNEVRYITAYRLMGMPCICILLDTCTEGEPAPFEEDYGTGYPCAFCYVLNLESDWCSEFGDVFFKKVNGQYVKA